MPNQVHDNICRLQEDIAVESRLYRRKAKEINLIAVSKKQPLEKVETALRAGHRIFGENRIQDARNRWEKLKQDYPDTELHFIGPLQTNKVREAVALFDFIHTVDRPKLAAALKEETQKQNRHPACLIQVNTGEEKQKHGVSPEDLPGLLNYCCKACRLDIKGLMCIPPLEDPPSMHFALLAKLAARHGLEELSMGMSNDYDKAIALGATYIRVGTALFGNRIRPPG